MSTSELVPAAPGRVRLSGERLRALRNRSGLSQDALALACFERQLCVSIASVKRAETGKSVLLRTARHLAAFHGVALAEILVDGPGGDEAEERGLPDELLVDEAGAPTRLTPTAWGLDGRRDEVNGGDEARLVLVLTVWPLPPSALPALEAIIEAEGGVLHAAPGAPTTQDAGGGQITVLFGQPRAQRSDVPRSVRAAQQILGMAGDGARGLLSVGVLAGGDLDWPLAREDWRRALSAEPSALYVHRTLDAALRLHHELQPSPVADALLLGEPLQRPGRAFRLVGRDAELKAFRGLLGPVLRDQQSQVWVLRGMAGMGKSRLLAECVDIAQQHFVQTQVVELQDFGGDRHRDVLCGLVSALLDLGGATYFRDELIRQRLAWYQLDDTSLVLCRELLGVTPSDADRALLEAMGHAQRAQLTARALAHLITRTALTRPLMLVVEDVHWASVATIETLARVVSASQEAQVLWVLSSRVEEPLRLADLRRLLPEVEVHETTLAPLPPREARELARQFPGDETWRQQCSERAQGHPLFLTQLLMAERHERLPDSFQHLLQVRLDDITPQDRQALRVAAVLGQPFTAAQLDALLPETGYALAPLVQHCFLRELGDGRYDFLHALIRQGVYGALPVRQREALHLEVARSMAPHDAVLHARHLHLARRPEAPARLLEAARQRHEARDHEGALSLLRDHEQVDYAERDVHVWAMLMGDVLAKTGQTGAARDAYRQAVDAAPDLPGRLTATVALAGVLNVLEDLQGEEALIDQALPLADRPDTRIQLAGLHYLKGNLYFPRGDVSRSREHHSRAMAVACDAGEVRLQARALSGLGDSFYAEGRMVTANARFVQCLALCDAHDLRDIEASNRLMLATTQIYLCETAPALRNAVASADLARQVGHHRAEIVSRLTASWIELGRGNVHGAVQHVDEGLRLARGIQAGRFEPFLQEALARAQHAQGDAEGAWRTIQQAQATVDRLGLHAFIGPWVSGTLALISPDEVRAREALSRGMAQIDLGCVAHNVYRFHAAAMEWHVLRGRHDDALRIGARWLTLTGAEPTPWVADLHAFMYACATGQPPRPGDTAWQRLREREILHVMLRLPRALLP